MASLSNVWKDPTLEAVDRAMEAAARLEESRTYLGMSSIGRECMRALWYQFRWVDREDFDAATLKRFEDGHLGEDLQAKRLRMAPGVTLLTVNADTGKQFGFTDHGGHFRGHMDGAIHGLMQALTRWHVWEHKSVGEDKFKKLQTLKQKHDEKEVLAKWDTTYHVQGQLYMHYTGMERHYLTCSTPGGRQTESVRTAYDPTVALRYIAIAEQVIYAAEPPPKIGNDPKFYLCNWCAFKDVCHSSKAPASNCRTCVHSTPVRNGANDDERWTCEKHAGPISVHAQRKGCDDHLPLPFLLQWAAPVDAGEGWIEFQAADGLKFVLTSPNARAATARGDERVITLAELQERGKAALV